MEGEGEEREEGEDEGVLGGEFEILTGEGGLDPQRRSKKEEDEGIEDEEEEEGGQFAMMGSWNIALGGEKGDRLVCCGFWDHTVKCFGGMQGGGPVKLQASGQGGHRGAVRCMKMGEDGRTLVTAGEDGTCR
eukprot:evm.model.NODE_34585_length_18702_cov_31.255749.1